MKISPYIVTFHLFLIFPGQWEGVHMTTGKTGHFPFTHVEFIDSENENEEQQCTDPNCPESQMSNNWCTDAKCNQGY